MGQYWDGFILPSSGSCLGAVNLSHFVYTSPAKDSATLNENEEVDLPSCSAHEFGHPNKILCLKLGVLSIKVVVVVVGKRTHNLVLSFVTQNERTTSIYLSPETPCVHQIVIQTLAKLRCFAKDRISGLARERLI